MVCVVVMGSRVSTSLAQVVICSDYVGASNLMTERNALRYSAQLELGQANVRVGVLIILAQAWVGWTASSGGE